MLSSAVSNYPAVLTEEQKASIGAAVVEGDPLQAIATIEHIVRLACCAEFAVNGQVAIVEKDGEVEFVVAPQTGAAVRDFLHAAVAKSEEKNDGS